MAGPIAARNGSRDCGGKGARGSARSESLVLENTGTLPTYSSESAEPPSIKWVLALPQGSVGKVLVLWAVGVVIHSTHYHGLGRLETMANVLQDA